jgi:hypothetical protein
VRTLDYTDVTYAGVIRMRGLPFNACLRTVTDFLGELSHAIKPGGVVLCEAQDGRRNGEAFVEFAKEAFASEAHKKDRQSIGSRYVEIFKVRCARERDRQAIWTGRSARQAPPSGRRPAAVGV